MSVAVPPVPQTGRPSEDELDGLLRAFYKAELPNPWPAPQVPGPRNDILPLRSAPPRFAMLRTRLALAACVAFFVAGPLFLSSYFNPANTETAATTEPAPIGGEKAQRVKPGDAGYHLLQKDGRTWIKVDGNSNK